jgi:hypothetical protein
MKTIKNNLEIYKLFASRYLYDPETGVFKNIRTGKSDYKPKPSGYIRLATTSKDKYFNLFGHRLAWFIHYGEMPPMVVDHINEDKTDNRISNLQLLSNRENLAKAIEAKGGTPSPCVGVTWSKASKKWRAKIKLPSNNKDKHLGYFDNEFVAANVAANALRSLAE